MCFSAEASFIAAAALGGIGAFSLARSPSLRTVPLRAVPMLFAAHQFVEGMIWRRWNAQHGWRLDHTLVHVWLLFALAIWPAWIPFSLALVEPKRDAAWSQRRTMALVTLAACGAAFGAWLFGHAVAEGGWTCALRGHLYHAVHLAPAMQPIVHGAYLVFVLAPFVISSRPSASRIGLAFAIAWVACALVYRTTVISTWCFFAAWLSVLVVRLPLAPARDVQASSDHSPVLRTDPAGNVAYPRRRDRRPT